MLNRKPYAENHKLLAEKQLQARLEILKSKGMTAKQMQRDPKVKHFQALIRQAKYQLGSIAELESEIARKAEAKAQKRAAPGDKPSRAERSAPEPVKKKAKKMKNPTAEAEE
jgi:hypothetical protein